MTAKASDIPFVGKLQHSHARVTAKPNVLYDKGGSDFRTPWHTSSLGKQPTSSKHNNTAPRVTLGKAPRFGKSDTIGPGPNMAQPSSFKKQLVSNRKAAPTAHFGTSTRDDALKQYAIYTTKK
mmetsp:Transcript_1890/g.3005  ORF Transcript_1890/g.3005 Transcript_1890/m.3005 type:complete len:123 (+) Transcript_1890:124-492(+)